MSDSSRRRSYAMFNHNFIGWNRIVARQTWQGFLTGTSIFPSFTSLTGSAYDLALLPGNYGQFSSFTFYPSALKVLLLPATWRMYVFYIFMYVSLSVSLSDDNSRKP